MKTCPYCGKEYVDSLRPEKQLKECPFCQTNFETGLPPKPKFDGGVVAVLLFGLFVFAIPFILCLLATGSLDYMDGTGAAFHIAGLAICLFTIYKYGNRVALYNTALNNPKEYVSQVTAARKEDEEKTQKEIAERKEKLARLPACPICGSKEYVERISNTDRSVEVAVWGLGASSVGKQFECRMNLTKRRNRFLGCEGYGNLTHFIVQNIRIVQNKRLMLLCISLDVLLLIFALYLRKLCVSCCFSRKKVWHFFELAGDYWSFVVKK